MAENKYTAEEVRKTIDGIFALIDKSFSKDTKKRLGLKEIYLFMGDLKGLFNIYAELSPEEAGRLSIKRYIKLITLLIKLEVSKERTIEYHNQLENAYRIAGRVSLEHFIVYYEWYEEDKFFEERYEILEGYAYYLNRMCFDRTFEGIIANLPSGYGKSRMVRYYEAFRLGQDPRRNIYSIMFKR